MEASMGTHDRSCSEAEDPAKETERVRRISSSFFRCSLRSRSAAVGGALGDFSDLVRFVTGSSTSIMPSALGASAAAAALSTDMGSAGEAAAAAAKGEAEASAISTSSFGLLSWPLPSALFPSLSSEVFGRPPIIRASRLALISSAVCWPCPC